MKMTAAAAIGALILAASAAPAMAGGYWDGGIVQSGPSGGPIGGAGRDCPCYCPRDRHDDGSRGENRSGWRDRRDGSASDGGYGEQRGWSDEQDYDSGWRDDGGRYDEADDAAPAEYSDDGYDDGGPSYVVGGGDSGGFAGNGAFVDLGFDFRDRDGDRFHDRDHFRDHDHFSDHDHHAAYAHAMQHDHQSYPQHAGGWGPMQPHQPMQAYHTTHMIAAYGRTGGYGHPAAHGGHRR